MPGIASSGERLLRWLTLSAAGVCWLAAPEVLAGPLPQPTLKSSDSIVLRDSRESTQEREELRREWRSRQSQADLTATVEGLLDRLQRMESTAAELNSLIRAQPGPSPAAPDPAAPTASPEGLPWLALAVGALGFFALGWIWRMHVSRVPPTPRGAVEPVLNDVVGAPEAFVDTVVDISPEKGDSLESLPPLGQPLPLPVVEEETALAESEFQASGVPDEQTQIEEFQLDLPPPQAMDDHDAELVEIMMTMGLSHGAARTLLEHVNRDPRRALNYWIKLIDVYRRARQKSEFEDTAKELRRHFNVHAFAWEGLPLQASLEDYPHIARQVCELWPEPAAAANYLEGLLADNRGGTRTGFPPPVAEEILLLLAMARQTA